VEEEGENGGGEWKQQRPGIGQCRRWEVADEDIPNDTSTDRGHGRQYRHADDVEPLAARQ
jgi:hypothetical protein